jgi:hypothetical protein
MSPRLYVLAGLPEPPSEEAWAAALPVLTAHARQLLEVGVQIGLEWWAAQHVYERCALVRAGRIHAVERAQLAADAASGGELGALRAQAYADPGAAQQHDLAALARVVGGFCA